MTKFEQQACTKDPLASAASFRRWNKDISTKMTSLGAKAIDQMFTMI